MQIATLRNEHAVLVTTQQELEAAYRRFAIDECDMEEEHVVSKIKQARSAPQKNKRLQAIHEAHAAVMFKDPWNNSKKIMKNINKKEVCIIFRISFTIVCNVNSLHCYSSNCYSSNNNSVYIQVERQKNRKQAQHKYYVKTQREKVAKKKVIDGVCDLNCICMNTCYYDHDELYCCVDLQKQLSVFRPKSPNVFTRTITNKRVAFVMNVRQPWAWALAKFYKDLENRMVAMCEDKILSLPFWVLICASAARVTRKDWLSLCTIMNTGHKHKHIHIPRIMDFRKGATNGLGLGGVIGAVKFDDTATTSKSK